MAFRGKRIRVEAAPVRDGWVPVVWHGCQLVKCLEEAIDKRTALWVAKRYAKEWFVQQRGQPKQATLF